MMILFFGVFRQISRQVDQVVINYELRSPDPPWTTEKSCLLQPQPRKLPTATATAEVTAITTAEAPQPRRFRKPEAPQPRRFRKPDVVHAVGGHGSRRAPPNQDGPIRLP